MKTKTMVQSTVNYNVGRTFDVLSKKLAIYGQLNGGSKYDKVALLWVVNVNDPSTYLEIEPKETSDGREFFLLHFKNPTNPTEKMSLPISGDDSAETFELWDCKVNTTFEANGKTFKKGTQKVRCYAKIEE